MHVFLQYKCELIKQSNKPFNKDQGQTLIGTENIEKLVRRICETQFTTSCSNSKQNKIYLFFCGELGFHPSCQKQVPSGGWTSLRFWPVAISLRNWVSMCSMVNSLCQCASMPNFFDSTCLPIRPCNKVFLVPCIKQLLRTRHVRQKLCKPLSCETQSTTSDLTETNQNG